MLFVGGGGACKSMLKQVSIPPTNQLDCHSLSEIFLTSMSWMFKEKRGKRLNDFNIKTRENAYSLIYWSTPTKGKMVPNTSVPSKIKQNEWKGGPKIFEFIFSLSSPMCRSVFEARSFMHSVSGVNCFVCARKKTLGNIKQNDTQRRRNGTKEREKEEVTISVIASHNEKTLPERKKIGTSQILIY